jgi:dihydropyrimidinase
MGTLLKNGTIVTEKECFIGDILTEHGVIKKICSKIDDSSHRVIDASGKYVLPGGIDVHTHLNIDVGIAKAVDDFYSGTVAAAFGGTTCIVDHMGFGPAGCNLHHQLKVYHEYAKDKAVIDYSFHGVIQYVNEEILKEMEAIVYEEGISSFKFYTTYDYSLNDYDAIRVMERLGELGAITAIHCENHGIINYLRKLHVDRGEKSPWFHAKSRPEVAEIEAIDRMIKLQSITKNSPLYLVHVSSGEGAKLIKTAKNSGRKIYGETCPQYLFLNEEMYKAESNEGLKYIMSPPLRDKVNNAMLWNSINEYSIDVIGTDHCPFNFNGEKQLGAADFTKCPNGAPGIEERVPLLYSYGVNEGRISINKFADIVSTSPAKLFGLYPKKGTLREGSDADIILIDPEKEAVMSKSILHGNADYSPYEGMKIKGYPIFTMVRGEIIVDNGVFLGNKGFGKFIKRKNFNV